MELYSTVITMPAQTVIMVRKNMETINKFNALINSKLGCYLSFPIPERAQMVKHVKPLVPEITDSSPLFMVTSWICSR